MKGKEFRIIILCAVLAVVALGCRLMNRSAAGVEAGGEMETEDLQRLTEGDFVVYGEVSAVGEETLTIKLGILESGKEELKLTGGEVAIRTKAGTVIERLRPGSAGSTGDRKTGYSEESSFAMENLEEGDVVSIALDEEGYAEKITLMDYSAVSAE